MRRPDPIAPRRKRPKRVAKKIAKRLGMMRYRGASYERFARLSYDLGRSAAAVLDKIVKERSDDQQTQP